MTRIGFTDGAGGTAPSQCPREGRVPPRPRRAWTPGRAWRADCTYRDGRDARVEPRPPNVVGGSGSTPTEMGMDARVEPRPPNVAGGSGSTPTVSRCENEIMQPERHRPIHLPNMERHNQPVILFVTVCTNTRRPILANVAMQRLLVASWTEAKRWHVGQYMIMPDHIHLFCSPAASTAPNVSAWVGFWKSLVSRAVKGFGPLAGLWTGAEGAGGTGGAGGTAPSRSLWQTDCWDTQLRHVRHYEEKWEYVQANPVRKGLVSEPAAWPYQGCLQELRW